jgi:hypothetical protein
MWKNVKFGLTKHFNSAFVFYRCRCRSAKRALSAWTCPNSHVIDSITESPSNGSTSQSSITSFLKGNLSCILLILICLGPKIKRVNIFKGAVNMARCHWLGRFCHIRHQCRATSHWSWTHPFQNTERDRVTLCCKNYRLVGIISKSWLNNTTEENPTCLRLQ